MISYDSIPDYEDTAYSTRLEGSELNKITITNSSKKQTAWFMGDNLVVDTTDNDIMLIRHTTLVDQGWQNLD